MQATTSYGTTGNPYTDGILMGTKWALPETLTFSFPTDPTFYGAGYSSGEPTNGFKAFTPVQQAAVRTILQMYSSVANVTFTEITETATQHADLRYAESNTPSTAYAFFPNTDPVGGDLWVNNSKHSYDNPVRGNYAWATMIHETGHAMGLKHPHNIVNGFPQLPVDHDTLEYSIMSYRSYSGGNLLGYTNAADSFPQTLMQVDIAGLQAMYGANYNSNSGDTVYTWSPTTGQEYINGASQGTQAGNKIFMTTWDGGGNDTYDFSNYTTNLNVNLQPGQWTTASTSQLAYLGAGHYAAGNIANALLYNDNPASLIENAIGGTGNDSIVGNDANNRLTGGGGNDKLNGGNGTDTAVYSGQAADYQIVQNSNGSWTVTDLRAGHPDGVDTLSFIEKLQFSDTVVSLGSMSATVALQVPVIGAISNDTAIAGDGITSAKSFSLIGAATAGSTVEVYDGAARLGTATADNNGAWSFAASNLAEGNHNFTAVASDISGKTTAPSPVFAVTVDTAAPTTPQITSFTPDTGVTSDLKTQANVVTLQGTAEAGSVVHIYDGTSVLGTTGADANGAWSFTTFDAGAAAQMMCTCPACMAARADAQNNPNSSDNAGSGTGALSEGQHAFTAVSIDAAGNTSTASAAVTITIDTIAPNAPVISKMSPDSGVVGDHITSAKVITFSGTAENSSVVKFYDGAVLLGSATATAMGTGSWSFATSALKSGSHVVTATATDAVGNVSGSTTFNVIVDYTAPVAPAVLAFGTDTGVAGDRITSSQVLNLTGTAEAGSTVTVYDGGALLGTAVTDGSGAWSYTTGVLGDGAHNLTAKATDVAGNTGGALSSFTVTIDSTGPAAPTLASTGNGNALTLTGGAEAGSVVKVYDGATLLGSTTANGSGAWSYTTGALANGSHNLIATATDVAGNTGAGSSALNVTIGSAAPGAPSIVSFGSDNGVQGDGITSAQMLNLTGSAQAGSIVKVYDGATLLGSATADNGGAWSYTTGSLADGGHNLAATATDPAGNTSAASSAFNVFIDSTAPNTPVIASFGNDTGAVGDGVTSAKVFNLTGSAEAGSTVKVYDGATLLGSSTANGSGAWSYNTGSLADGLHSLTATAADIAGNVGAPSSALKVTVDSAAPNGPTIASFGNDTGVQGDGITSARSLNLTGSAEAGSTVKVFDGATLLGSVTANSSGAWSYDSGPLADGAHSLMAIATDAAGNTGTPSSPFDVMIDSAAPNGAAITSFGNDTGVLGDGITGTRVLNLSGSAEAGSTVNVYDGATLLGSVAADDGGGWGYITGPLADGFHSITAAATDAAGNTGAASSPLVVMVDSTAPGVPSIITFGPDPDVVGDGSDVVTTLPGSADANGSITNVKVFHLTGSSEAGSMVKIYDGATLLGSAMANGNGAWNFTTGALSEGAHSLTATATDAAGNTGVPSSALNVTVDSTAPNSPVIASFGSDTGLTGDGITGARVLNLTGSAEAGGVIKVYDGSTLLGSTTANGSGSWNYTTGSLADGAHSLIATATDAAGNTGTVSQALNVTVDSTAPNSPVIASFGNDTGVTGDGITSARVLNLTGSAEAGSVIKVYDGSTLLGNATANGSGNWNYTTSSLADGVHSLTATAADAAGNTGTASQALNVTVDSAAANTPVVASFDTDTGIVGDGVTSAKVLNLSGTAEADSTVRVYDGGALLGNTTADGNGAWAYVTGSLSDGAHSLAATATDAAGNTGAISSVLKVTVDSTAPNTPVIVSFGNDADVTGDGVTNTNVLNLAGSAEIGSTVQVYDGATLLGSTTASGNGTWVFTTAALADGPHSLAAVATDVASNAGAISAPVNVTIDSAAPGTPLIASFRPVLGTAGGGIGSTPVFDLTGTAEAGSTVQVYDGATLLGSVTADDSGAWSYIIGSLANGAHSLTAVATDAADNSGLASSVFKVTTTTAVGSTTSTTAVYADGSKEVLVSGITGQKWTATDTLYGANGKAISQVCSNGDTIVKIQTWNADGSTKDVHYYGITGQAYTDYTVTYVNNKQACAEYSNGMTQNWSYNADGTLHELVVNGISGQKWTTTDTLYGVNGKAVSQVWSDGDTVVKTQTWNADGSTNDIHYYGITGQAYTDYVVTFANNKQATATYSNGMIQAWTYNADGSLHELVVNGISGQKWTSTDTLYGANGKAVSQVWSDGDTLVKTQTWNADGTIHDIHYYGVTGQAYTDYEVTYANNKQVTADYSNGMTQAWTYNADGMLQELVVNGITGQKWTSTDTLYGVNGKALSQVWSDGDTLVKTQTWNADGTTHDVHYYGVTGQAYTDYEVLYGAGNKPVSATYSNGMTQAWTYNADGTLHDVAVDGIIGQKWTSTDTLYGVNGKAVSQIWSDGDTLVKTQTWNADGTTHDVHYYGVTGQAYTDYEVVYGANNKSVSASYSNGMTVAWSYNDDGSYSMASDHVQGQSYASYVNIYDPNLASNGHLAVRETTDANASETIRGYESGLTIEKSASGTSVTLPGLADDAFHFAFNSNTTMTGGGANTNFVLQDGFGQVTVTDFFAHSLPNSDGDTITFGHGLFQDFADLQSHMSQDTKVGNTIIADNSGNTLVLNHTLIAQLHANDFILL